MKKLLPIVALLAACDFNPDLGEKYYPCKPNGTCPGECVCLEGQICVPQDNQGPDQCAWCEDGQTLCRYGQTVQCVFLDSDPKNCGSCGHVCLLPNAEAECDQGACVIAGCLDCYQDCDRLAHTGCETCPESDPYNCGECGVVCDDPPPAVCEDDNLRFYLDEGDCVSSKCQYPSSTRPCEHGCENGACNDDPCIGVSCNNHQHCEDGLCVCDSFYEDCDFNNLNGCETYINTTSDCGDCGFSCGQNSICVDGSCDCQYGFGNCDDSWATGCEEDVLHNQEHCGECNNECGPGLTCCTDQCVDTNSDRGNCGRCNFFCTGLTECCQGICTDVQLNPENCGTCGTVCFPPTGTCCWGSCVDLTSDDKHCGECSNACAQNLPCHQGSCGAQGIRCGSLQAVTCDFWEERCCYGANGIACYPTNDCSARIVECDDDSDCGDSLYCCFIDDTVNLTQCNSNCSELVCASDEYCLQQDPGTPFCCPRDYYGQPVNLCQSEVCQ